MNSLHFKWISGFFFFSKLLSEFVKIKKGFSVYFCFKGNLTDNNKKKLCSVQSSNFSIQVVGSILCHVCRLIPHTKNKTNILRPNKSLIVCWCHDCIKTLKISHFLISLQYTEYEFLPTLPTLWVPFVLAVLF